MFKLPTLLITGADGQLGYELAAVAQEDGFNVVALTHEQLDVTDLDAVVSSLTEHNPDYVVNAAGQIIPQDVQLQVDFSVNTIGPEVLAKACVKTNCALIHLSCTDVFDGELETAYQENQKQNPISAYGDSIIQGERAIRQFLPRHLIVRTGWVFSGRGSCPVRSLLEHARRQPEVEVADGLNGCPTAASDVARVVLALVKQFDCGIDNWGTYHYCSSEPISWFGFCEAVIAAARQYENLALTNLVMVPNEQLLGFARPANAVLDCSAVLRNFGVHQRAWRMGLMQVMRTLYAAPED